MCSICILFKIYFSHFNWFVEAFFQLNNMSFIAFYLWIALTVENSSPSLGSGKCWQCLKKISGIPHPEIERQFVVGLSVLLWLNIHSGEGWKYHPICPVSLVLLKRLSRAVFFHNCRGCVVMSWSITTVCMCVWKMEVWWSMQGCS